MPSGAGATSQPRGGARSRAHHGARGARRRGRRRPPAERRGGRPGPGPAQRRRPTGPAAGLATTPCASCSRSSGSPSGAYFVALTKLQDPAADHAGGADHGHRCPARGDHRRAAVSRATLRRPCPTRLVQGVAVRLAPLATASLGRDADRPRALRRDGRPRPGRRAQRVLRDDRLPGRRGGQGLPGRRTPPPARCATRSTAPSSTASRRRSTTRGWIWARSTTRTPAAPRIRRRPTSTSPFYPDALYVIVGLAGDEPEVGPTRSATAG